MSKVLSITKNTIWGLGALSVASCLARNDYNVVFSILFILVLSNFYNQNPQVSSKIIVQLLSVLVIADIIWIITMSASWTHSDEALSEEEVFWNSLRYMHGFVYVLAYIEMILKALLIYYLFTDFKTKYNWKELFSFNYSMQDGGNIVNLGRPIGETIGQMNNVPDVQWENKY